VCPWKLDLIKRSFRSFISKRARRKRGEEGKKQRGGEKRKGNVLKRVVWVSERGERKKEEKG